MHAMRNTGFPTDHFFRQTDIPVI